MGGAGPDAGPTVSLWEGLADQLMRMAEMAMRPMVATKTLLIRPWYFAMAGTRLMAYMGMRNRMVAMMGPPRVLIIPRRMEG